MEQQMKKLHKVLSNYDIMNQSTKEDLHKAGKAFLKKVAQELEFKDHKISSNKAGPAVSGEISLYGMVEEDRGIFIQVSQDGFVGPILYRSIKKINDYTGGHNNFISTNELTDADSVMYKFKRIIA